MNFDFEMPTFGEGIGTGYDSYAPGNFDLTGGQSDNNLAWPEAPDLDYFATDEELSQMMDYGGYEGDNDFWGDLAGGVWDFATSDTMVKALSGMADLGLDMWRAENMPKSIRGGGGSSRPVHQKDPSKMKAAPHTFKRKESL